MIHEVRKDVFLKDLKNASWCKLFRKGKFLSRVSRTSWHPFRSQAGPCVRRYSWTRLTVADWGLEQRACLKEFEAFWEQL
jgi:hypothetical protein